MVNVKKKRSIWNYLAEECIYDFVLIVMFFLTIVPFAIGKLLKSMNVNYIMIKVLPDWINMWITGISLYVVLLTILIVIYLIFYRIPLIIRIYKACNKTAYLPLSEQELECNNIVNASQYLEYIYDCICYKKPWINDYKNINVNLDEVEKQLFTDFKDTLPEAINNKVSLKYNLFGFSSRNLDINEKLESNPLNLIACLEHLSTKPYVKENYLSYKGVQIDTGYELKFIIYYNYELIEEENKYRVNFITKTKHTYSDNVTFTYNEIILSARMFKEFENDMNNLDKVYDRYGLLEYHSIGRY